MTIEVAHPALIMAIVCVGDSFFPWWPHLESMMRQKKEKEILEIKLSLGGKLLNQIEARQNMMSISVSDQTDPKTNAVVNHQADRCG